MRLLLRVGLVLLGAFTAICSLIAYRHAFVVGPVLVPWGLCLVLAAVYMATRAAAILDGPLAGAISYGAGWAALLLACYQQRAEGDYLVSADFRGYGLVLGGLGVIAVAIMRSASQPTTASAAPPSRLAG